MAAPGRDEVQPHSGLRAPKFHAALMLQIRLAGDAPIELIV
ncbi:MAG: hypothetical protein ACMG6H_03335 [Acidobacteriota bacterium]